jgi:hypothetical protein
MRSGTPLLLILTLLAAPPLAADIVHLKSGKLIEGKVHKDISRGTYTIETPLGTVVKPIRDVLRVEKAPLPATVFDRRFAKVDQEDVQDLAKLVAFCREKRLVPRKHKVCRLILEIDPNHEMARKELGYVVFENEWILDKELRKKRTELGLVKHLGEWMSPEEKRRRVIEAERKEVAGLFKSVRSDNKIVLEYAVRKLMAYGGPYAYELFTPYLEDANEHVRLVTASALSRFPVKKSKSTGTYDPRGAKPTKSLYEVFLLEPSEKVVEVLLICLRRFHPDETFRSTLATLQTDTRPEILTRASRLAEGLLLKRRMPDVCRALVTTRTGPDGKVERVENPAIHKLLTNTINVDHGYDVEEWLGWWKKNEWRFRDVP